MEIKIMHSSQFKRYCFLSRMIPALNINTTLEKKGEKLEGEGGGWGRGGLEGGVTGVCGGGVSW